MHPFAWRGASPGLSCRLLCTCARVGVRVFSYGRPWVLLPFFSLAARSDWPTLGRGDIMFSPKPTCIPHLASAVHRCHDCVCLRLCVCASVRERKQEVERERESCVSEGGLLCVQASARSALSAKVLLVSLAKADEGWHHSTLFYL